MHNMYLNNTLKLQSWKSLAGQKLRLMRDVSPLPWDHLFLCRENCESSSWPLSASSQTQSQGSTQLSFAVGFCPVQRILPGQLSLGIMGSLCNSGIQCLELPLVLTKLKLPTLLSQQLSSWDMLLPPFHSFVWFLKCLGANVIKRFSIYWTLKRPHTWMRLIGHSAAEILFWLASEKGDMDSEEHVLPGCSSPPKCMYALLLVTLTTISVNILGIEV